MKLLDYSHNGIKRDNCYRRPGFVLSEVKYFETLFIMKHNDIIACDEQKIPDKTKRLF